MKKKFIVNGTTILLDKKRYEAGGEIELDEQQAKRYGRFLAPVAKGK